MKTIKTILFATVILLSGQNLYAQASIFGASVVGGGNISQMTGDADGGFNKLGLHAGLKASIRLGFRTEMGVGIQYEQRGSRNRSTANTTAFPFKIKTSYVVVPVTYAFKDWYEEEDNFYRIHFIGGLMYGRLFQSSQEGGRVLDECVEDFRDDDISWQLGASYFWSKHWGVNVMHSRSILDLNQSLGDCAQDLRPFQWTFRLEYRF